MGCVPSIPKESVPSKSQNSGTETLTASPKRPAKRRGSAQNDVHLDMRAYEEQLVKKERERERMMHEILNQEKSDLHNKAFSLIERRLSCENLLEDHEGNEIGRLQNRNSVFGLSEHSAALKLHQENRRKQAKLIAEAEEKWMVFSGLEIFDDADLSCLAHFMNIVIRKIPELQEQLLRDMSITNLTETHEDEDGIIISRDNSNNSLLNLVSIQKDNSANDLITLTRSTSTGKGSSSNIFALRENSTDAFMNLNKIAFSSSSTINPSYLTSATNASNSGSNTQRATLIANKNSDGFTEDYDLPSGIITLPIATQIIALYKAGGKLSMKAVHKICRLAYRKIKKLSNTSRVIIGPTDRCVVVGDIHGQLPDLIHIIEEAGFPSHHNKFIFNGDFVDRGPQGVEIMCVLLSLYAAMPNQVYLNRGNHEDFAICCAYGFQAECLDKYDDVTFGMFVEIFNYLPLFAIINDAVFVVHGGLFHARDATLAELNMINRFDFSLSDVPEGGEPLEGFPRGTTPEEETLFLKQLQRDSLWSDPREIEGNGLNPRGAGVAFGPDVTRQFLQRNNLKMIVRSHECVRSGFDRPFKDSTSDADAEGLLCTIFSASNYGGGGNSAAYMVFSSRGSRQRMSIGNSLVYKVNGSDQLTYTVHYFHIDEQELSPYSLAFHGDQANEAREVEKKSSDSLMLKDIILRKRLILLEAFRALDPQFTGFVSAEIWADVMHHTLKMAIRFSALLPVLVKPQAFKVNDDGTLNKDMINYLLFIDSLSLDIETPLKSSTDRSSRSNSIDDDMTVVGLSLEDNQSSKLQDAERLLLAEEELSVQGALVEALYPQAKKLELAFRYFDKDGNGVITKEEFMLACDALNASLTDGMKLEQCERVMSIMDVKETHEIDINIFFEMYRMAEIKIGLLSNQSLADASSPTSPLVNLPPNEISLSRRFSFSHGTVEAVQLFDSNLENGQSMKRVASIEGLSSGTSSRKGSFESTLSPEGAAAKAVAQAIAGSSKSARNSFSLDTSSVQIDIDQAVDIRGVRIAADAPVSVLSPHSQKTDGQIDI